MKPFPQRRLTMAAVIGMAYWLFGNLYESMVFSPNWVRDSPAQFTRLNEFFTVTGPTLYFIPVTPIALILVWLLWWRNRDAELERDYRRAGQASILLTALTTYIVAALISKMFGPDALSHSGDLNAAAWQWNALNIVRMLLTATATYHLFRAFRKLDHRLSPMETAGR